MIFIIDRYLIYTKERFIFRIDLLVLCSYKPNKEKKMKVLLSLVLLFSIENSFATSSTSQQANLFSSDEVNSLRDSVERVLPSFKQFQKQIKTDSSFSLYLANACYKKIIAYVRYLDLNNNWVDAGFWELKNNQETYIGETKNIYYYPGAYSVDGKLEWGDIPVVFKDHNLFVSKKEIDRTDWGDWVNKFTCN
jgi:hypothetical protein